MNPVCKEVSKLFYGGFFVTLFAVLLPIKSPVASADFWITFLKVALSASVADFFSKLLIKTVFTASLFT